MFFSNIHHETCDKQYVDNVLQVFALEMFYKHLTATGFHNSHFKTFLKRFLSNVLTTFHHICFCNHVFRILIKLLPSSI